jgi:transcriptional regulator with XRE-family HTH domain
MPNIIDLSEHGHPTAQLFGERLKERRRALGLTQAQLFEKTGITAAYVSLIERGQGNPTLDMMVKLAEAVGAEAWDMIRPPPTQSSGSVQNR